MDLWNTRDRLGTLRVATDASGQRELALDLLPFGLEVASMESGVSGSLSRPFTGHERAQGLGVDYMLARSCAVGLRRFATVDPLACSAEMETSQTWCRYAYVRN